MNKHLRAFTFMLALAAACPLAVLAGEPLENNPAYLPIDKAIDLKVIRPEVNVNLPRFLLQDAASELNGSTNDPLAATGINFADLVKDVQLIRVVVIEAHTNDRDALEKGVKKLRADLDTKWTPVVNVPDEHESVGVYAMGDPSGDSMAGLAVLVYDGHDAVIVNVVGHVSIAKLIRVATHMKALPKDFMEKLGSIGNEAGPGTNSGSNNNGNANANAAPSKPAENPGAEAGGKSGN